MTNKNSLGGRLRTLRKEKGLYQKDIAQALGITPVGYSSIENNKIARPRCLDGLAQFFDVEVDYLLHGNKEENQTENPISSILPAQDADHHWLTLTDTAMAPEFKETDSVLLHAQPAQAGNLVGARVDGSPQIILRYYKPCRFDDTGREYCQLVPTCDLHPVIDSRYQTFEIVGVAIKHIRHLKH